MPTSTTNFGLQKPLVNNATDQDLWGGYLNDDLDEVDSLSLTFLNWTPSPKTSSFSVTAHIAGSPATGSCKVLYLCDATTGNIVPSLPAASTAAGMVVGFKKTDVSVNNITITPNGSEKIDGASTVILSLQYDWVIIECDGVGWNVISKVSPPNPIATNSTVGTVKPDNVSTFVDGSGALSAKMTPLAVGAIILATNNTASQIPVGNTLAADNLIIEQLSSTGGIQGSGDSISGTWRALQTVSVNGSTGGTGLWQRIV